MKEKLLAALRIKFPKTQTALLERVAGIMASTATDETLDTIASGDGIKDLITFYQSETDRRATEAVTTYERNHKIKDGKPVVTDEPPKPDDDPTMPAWAKSILKQNQELVSEVQNLKKGHVITNLMEKVKEKLKDKKIPDTFFNGKTIEKEEDVDTLATQIEQDYQTVKQHMVNEGVVIDKPATPAGGGNTTAIDEEIKAWAK